VVPRACAAPAEVRTKRARAGVSLKPIQNQSPRERRSRIGEDTIRAALRQDRLLFAFQPVVCATTGKIHYFECLLRLRNKRGSIVAGGKFIKNVENLGLIGLIDHYVLERTIQELNDDPEVSLGLNISGLTARDRAWLQSLLTFLHRRSDIAHRLVVEITETAAIDDMEESARFVASVRRTGCRVALDDFGAGHTSLRHLQTLPLDIVKIDGSLVRDLTSKGQSRVFLRYLLNFIKNLGFSTVAEGIENAKDAALLRAEGIGYLQGYHVGRPTIERARLAKSQQAIS
jgi:EAL domain-containing protein (putative c-di-GMP-specific phosphodiesterase class I)